MERGMNCMIVRQSRDNFWMLNWLDKFMEGHKGFICGGCFKNIFNEEKVKDLDIFFKSHVDWAEAVEYFDSMTAGYSDEETEDTVSDEDAEYRFLYENDNVKAYTHKKTGVRLELCSKVFGMPEDVINQFDFTITKFAYYKAEVEDETGAEYDGSSIVLNADTCGYEKPKTHIEYKIMHDDKFFEHLHLKRLVTDNKIPYPISTFERMLKYAKYGYFPCKETKLKIIRALREVPDSQIAVSESLYEGMD